MLVPFAAVSGGSTGRPTPPLSGGMLAAVNGFCLSTICNILRPKITDRLTIPRRPIVDRLLALPRSRRYLGMDWRLVLVICARLAIEMQLRVEA